MGACPSMGENWRLIVSEQAPGQASEGPAGVIPAELAHGPLPRVSGPLTSPEPGCWGPLCCVQPQLGSPKAQTGSGKDTGLEENSRGDTVLAV